MNNLSVSGAIKIGSDLVATVDDCIDWDNPTAIFDSTSVSSTGIKYLDYLPNSSTQRYEFSSFKILLFCFYNASAGWKTVLLPRNKFTSAIIDNYVIINQSVEDTNRRIHIIYQTESSFNIGYAQNSSRLLIYGFK